MIDLDKSLFHYTDIGAVASIVKNKVLWLTDSQFLNDTQELHDGIAQIQNAFSTLRSNSSKFTPFQRDAFGWVKKMFDSFCEEGYQLQPLFTCSFSRNGNLLSQWRGYGSFAVEFSRREIEEDFDLYDCIYDPSEKVSAAYRGLTKSINAMADAIRRRDLDSEEPINSFFDVIYSAGSYKNSYFESEQEVRIVSAMEGEKVQHRAKGHCLIPYVVRGFNPAAIKAVHIGPIADQDLAEKSLRSLFMAAGMPDLPVVKSDIPYRA